MAKKNIFEIIEEPVKPKEEIPETEDEKEKVEDVEAIDLNDPYIVFINRIDELLERIYKGEVSQVTCFTKEMQPTLKYNKSELQILYTKNFKRGDIVLLQTPNGYSIKRLIKFIRNGILLLGDNEKKYTLIIDKELMLAKIVGKIEKTKYTSFNSEKIKKKAYKKYVKRAWLRTKGRINNEYINTEVSNNTEIENEAIFENIPNNAIVDIDESIPDIDFLEK